MAGAGAGVGAGAKIKDKCGAGAENKLFRLRRTDICQGIKTHILLIKCV